MAKFIPILSQSRGVLEPKDFLRGLSSVGLATLACRSLRLLFPLILFTPGIMPEIYGPCFLEKIKTIINCVFSIAVHVKLVKPGAMQKLDGMNIIT